MTNKINPHCEISGCRKKGTRSGFYACHAPLYGITFPTHLPVCDHHHKLLLGLILGKVYVKFNDKPSRGLGRLEVKKYVGEVKPSEN